jgi:hypothetical protein
MAKIFVFEFKISKYINRVEFLLTSRLIREN